MSGGTVAATPHDELVIEHRSRCKRQVGAIKYGFGVLPHDASAAQLSWILVSWPAR
jgi:hypothetical protein